MEFLSPDRLGKIVINILTPGRLTVAEEQFWPSVRGDLVIREGPDIPRDAGLISDLFRYGSTLLEFYSGYARSSDLWGAYAKVLLLGCRENERKATLSTCDHLRLVVVTVGSSKAAFRRAFGDFDRLEVERGIECYVAGVERIHIDLLRLRVDLQTAWLHVAGSSPYLDLALHLLSQEGSKQVMTWLNALKKEVPKMETMLQEVDPASRQAARSFLKAWERVAALREGKIEGKIEGKREGKIEGKREGKIEGKRQSAMLILENRFGTAAVEVAPRLEAVQSDKLLDSIIKHALSAADLNEFLHVSGL